MVDAPKPETDAFRVFSNTGGLGTGLGSFNNLGDLFLRQAEQAYGKPADDRMVCVKSRKIVVKVGTSVVTRGHDQRLALGRLGSLIEQLEVLCRSGRQPILVTSGATAVGRQKLRHQLVLNSSPLEMQTGGMDRLCSRAAAAAGQSGLMALYDSMFSMMDMQAAQVLVTANDFANDKEFTESLIGTVDNLLSANVIPVFNENDALNTTAGKRASDKKFWDNDSLAVLLAEKLEADLVILLSDVNGLFDANPKEDENAKLVSTFSPELHGAVSVMGTSQHGRGGMSAKIQSAWQCACKNIPCVVANGTLPENLLKVVSGVDEGTLFHRPAAERAAEEANAIRMMQQNNLGTQVASSTEMAVAARQASRVLQALPTEKRCEALYAVAAALEANIEQIMQANEADMAQAQGNIDENLLNRLKLTPKKVNQLADGIRAIANLDEPIRRQLSKMELAEGLILEKVTAPIGVLLIIFEARPDALPQIAALSIRSGNGLLLKGGKEAMRSNRCLHHIISTAIADIIDPHLIGLVESREEIDDLLRLDNVIDLVIPRGSNQLVTYIQSNTKIPVLGHADGICHIYVDEDADIDKACQICVDSKVDYPAACNAVEKILVHRALANTGGLFRLQSALAKAGVTVYGGEKSSTELSIPRARGDRVEYGTNEVTLELVDCMLDAIDHIHAYGSGHTEAIITDNQVSAEEFLKRVDSACVFHNASTRFSDGYRFGLGAEVGISTSRIHARGPVGVEGLLTTRYLLHGEGQICNKDTGVEYTHKPIA